RRQSAISIQQSTARGQLHHEAHPLGTVVLDSDHALVLLDDPAHDGQAEAASPLLGREMRHEELVAVLGRYAGAIVGHPEPHAPVGAVELGGDYDGALLLR